MDIVGKLWSFCHKLRHDGVDASDYIEQLTYLLFLKMADEKRLSVPEDYDWQSLLSKNNGELVEHLEKIFRVLNLERGLIGQIFIEPISRIKNHILLGEIIIEINKSNWNGFDADEIVESFEKLVDRKLIRFLKNYKIIQNLSSPKEGTYRFDECAVSHKESLPKKIHKEEILPSGNYPIISQSHQEIIGYTNNETALFTEPLPIIVFGDHTRIFKYVDYPFAIYGDGVKIIIPNTEILLPKYLFYALKASFIPDLGYSRHFSEVKKLNIYVPSLEEQAKIVENLDKKFSDLEEKEQRIEQEKKEIQQLKDSLFQYFFNKKAQISA